jgi:D-alanyl-D-alanine carboxypeptidase
MGLRLAPRIIGAQVEVTRFPRRDPNASPMKLRAVPVIPTLVILAAGLVPLAGCARTSARDTVEARVDSLVAAFQQETYAPGVSVAVVRAGRDTLVYRGYGLADVENDVPATPETVYRIGSISKQFTAAAVLRLAEQNRLSLDDPIVRHLPNLPPAWSGIRIRQLLSHTGGIPNFQVRWLHEGVSEEALTPDSVVGLVRNEPLDFPPGTQWRYSNIGYTVLGMLLEKMSEEPYRHYLQSALLRPLGLASTRYCDLTSLIRHRAEGYEQRDTSVVNAMHTSMTVPFAAGGLCSTVGDMAAWNHALATGRVVSAASWARMTTPDSAARETGYGYGLAVKSIDGRRVIRHSGGIQGFRADNAYVPGDSLSVTVLTNIAAPGPEALLDEIVRAALAASATP